MSEIVFDLDGTLIDSAPDLLRAANALLDEAKRQALSLETLRGFIGEGVAKLIERVAAARDLPPESVPDLTARFLEIYEAAPSELTTLYPGVRAALAALDDAGYRLSVCTNKPEAPSKRILSDFDLRDAFAAVIGGDSLPERKPSPAPLFAALGPGAADRAVLVGDSEIDAETARAARVRFVLFVNGYRRGPVETIPHDAAFEHYRQLPDIVPRLLG